MNVKDLISMNNAATDIIVNAIKQYVMENGEEPTWYENHQFGLDDENDDEHVVIKVLNFFDNGGCYFFEPDSLNSDVCEDINDENWSDRLYQAVTHTSYQCLYIVETVEGDYELKYYRFTNGGINWDDDQSEPDHGYVANLNLLDLHYLISAIKKIEEV